MSTEPTILSAPFTLEYTFKRSLGPVLTAFFMGLHDKRFFGSRTRKGQVLMPPSEYDPETGEALNELVQVGETGVVTSFTWVDKPTPQQPLKHPFAYALIKLDGADTALLHAVDTQGDPAGIRIGSRVRARWAQERVGAITDVLFVPDDAAQAEQAVEPVTISAVADAQMVQKAPVQLHYRIYANETLTRFLLALKEGKILGRRDPATNRIYCPPRAGSPTHGVDMAEYVEVKDHGTLTTFCVVNVAFEGQVMKVPYVYGAILLDGSDTPFLHLVQTPPENARMGLRLKAVWKPPHEREGSFTDIKFFEPSGEPDAAYETYQEYL